MDFLRQIFKRVRLVRLRRDCHHRNRCLELILGLLPALKLRWRHLKIGAFRNSDQRQPHRHGARGGTRTHTSLQITDFKSVAYTIPPPGRGLGLLNSDCGMKWGAWQASFQSNCIVPSSVAGRGIAYEDRFFGR